MLAGVVNDRRSDCRPPFGVEGEMPHSFISGEPCLRSHFSELLSAVEGDHNVASAMNHESWGFERTQVLDVRRRRTDACNLSFENCSDALRFGIRSPADLYL